MLIKGMNMERTNIYATKKQLDAIKKIAQETGLVMSEIIRRAIDAYLENRRDK